MKNLNKYQKFFLSIYILVLAMWVYIQVKGIKTTDFNFAFSFIFGLIPFFGGLTGMIKSRQWGGLKSVLGKGVFFFSFGLFLWGFGENIWSYYNFFRNEPAPYPSIADIGFAPSIFFWILGTAYLAKASGAIYAFKKHLWIRLFSLVLPIILFVASYWIHVKVARGGVLVPPGETPLKVVLDIAYPLGDFLAVTFALVTFTLTNKYLGGRYKHAIAFVLLGLITMYFGDFSFSYTTTAGTFYNGNWGDLLLASGNFFMTFGILGFATKPSVAGTNTTVKEE